MPLDQSRAKGRKGRKARKGRQGKARQGKEGKARDGALEEEGINALRLKAKGLKPRAEQELVQCCVLT